MPQESHALLLRQLMSTWEKLDVERAFLPLKQLLILTSKMLRDCYVWCGLQSKLLAAKVSGCGGEDNNLGGIFDWLLFSWGLAFYEMKEGTQISLWQCSIHL